MRTEKKLWLYCGLGIPSGVALVRPAAVDQSNAWRRVLLLGGQVVRGLAPPLAQLAACSEAALHVDMDEQASARDWARGDKLKSHLAVFRPTSVIFALDPRDMLARRCIRARLSHVEARDIWMIPPGDPFPESARCIPSPPANLAGFASWAARAWSMVK